MRLRNNHCHRRKRYRQLQLKIYASENYCNALFALRYIHDTWDMVKYFEAEYNMRQQFIAFFFFFDWASVIVSWLVVFQNEMFMKRMHLGVLSLFLPLFCHFPIRYYY